MITFLQFLENYKLEDQTFSDSNGTYNVKQLIDFATKNKKIQNINIKELEHNLEPSEHETGDELPGDPAFIARANKADLKYPIVVVKYNDGLWIADGVHRLWKAKHLKRSHIRGYVIDQSELKKFMAPY